MKGFFAVISFAATVVAQANAPPLVFNCGDRLEDVCSNMCWGAYCTVPAFGSSLMYDNYQGQGGSGQVARDRRTSAGCLPSPNRCSTSANPPNPRAGENCDEYPFASTSNSDAGGQVSRCVISRHNSRQGGIISAYTRANCPNGTPCQLVITFGNPAAPNVRYCQAFNDRAGQCINDGNPPIFKNGAPDADFASTGARIAAVDEPTSALFLLASGMEAIMPIDTAINSTVMHPRAADAELKAMADEDEDDEAEGLLEWNFESDYVVAKVA